MLQSRRYPGLTIRGEGYYSGKRHTVKIQYMVNGNGLILHKTGHERGRKHDYSIYKEKHPITLIG